MVKAGDGGATGPHRATMGTQYPDCNKDGIVVEHFNGVTSGLGFPGGNIYLGCAQNVDRRRSSAWARSRVSPVKSGWRVAGGPITQDQSRPSNLNDGAGSKDPVDIKARGHASVAGRSISFCLGASSTSRKLPTRQRKQGDPAQRCR